MPVSLGLDESPSTGARQMPLRQVPGAQSASFLQRGSLRAGAVRVPLPMTMVPSVVFEAVWLLLVS